MKNCFRPQVVFTLDFSKVLLNVVSVFLLSVLASVFNPVSAQSVNVVEDPCMSLSATMQTSRGTETSLKKLQLSALDSSLYKYWNKSSEDRLVKIKKIEESLNNRKDKNVVSYVVDPCDPGGGRGGCTINPPIPWDDTSLCGAGSITMSATPGSGGNIVYWYEDYSSTSPFYIGNSVTVSVSASRYYYLSSFNTTTGCESYKISVYITVGGWGVDGNISAPVTAIYLGQSVTISSTGGTGVPHYWCSSNGGASWNVFSDSYIGQTSFTYTPAAIGTYRFMLRNKTGCGFCYDNGTCPNYPYVDIMVINASPALPSIQTSFIYAYNNLVVAEVTNANINQIAYSSFESADKGYWTYSGVPVGSLIDVGRTGNKYYNLSSGNIQRAGLPVGKYVVTYWSNGDPGITGTNYTLNSKITEGTINGWILYRVTFTLSTGSSTITISGSSKIDEIRLHPHNAYMNTSTFDPLVGKTSEIDANNRIIYYIYDEFNRLKVIKDQNGHIRKSYTYNYKN